MLFSLGSDFVGRVKSLAPARHLLPVLIYLAITVVAAPNCSSGAQSCGQQVLAQLPPCEGLKSTAAFRFSWPNYERRMRELQGGEIYYYRCRILPGEAAKFIRARMKNPPYNLGEINWVHRGSGVLGIYYNYATKQWIYLWVVPDQGSGARIVLAKARGKRFSC